MHLAEYNRGILRHDWDDPRVADFVNNIAAVNAVAQRAPGFVWMLDEAAMGAAQADLAGPLGGHPRLASTLSVWDSADSLRAFVFRTVHRQFLDRGPEWYDPGQGLRMVLWWVPKGHRPSVAEAAARFDQLAQRGPRPEAFGWDWLKTHPNP